MTLDNRCADPSQKTTFSVVIPVYKNERNIQSTVDHIASCRALFPSYELEVIMVNDGSPDRSWDEMVRAQSRYPEMLSIISLTRNFGQGAATHCGIAHAHGAVIGVISADLQDPFELFVDMLEAWSKGSRMVVASRKDREDRKWTSFCSNLMHHFVHRCINRTYPKGGFDFYLIDRSLADQFRSIDTIKGGTQLELLWFGYDFAEIPYTRMKRTVGKSSWSVLRKIDAALRWTTIFSDILLKAILGIGLLLCLASLIGTILFAIFAYLPGVALSVALLLTGLIMLSCGIVGEYACRALDYAKGYPRYIVRDEIKCSSPSAASDEQTIAHV